MELMERPDRLIVSSNKEIPAPSMFNSLLDGSEHTLHDMSMDVWTSPSTNIFKSTDVSTESSTTTSSSSSSSAASDKTASQEKFLFPTNESILASPNPGVSYELMYEEVTPVKRDLFGLHESDNSTTNSDDSNSDNDSGSASDSSLPSIALLQQQQHHNALDVSNFKQCHIDPSRFKCPSCNKHIYQSLRRNHLDTHQGSSSRPQASPPKLSVQEVHRHFHACLSRHSPAVASSKDSTQILDDEKKLETDIIKNVNRVRRAIGKFELQDQIKIMDSLYRLSKVATAKPVASASRRSSLSSLYSSINRSSSVNEAMDADDQHVLSLLYCRKESSSASSSPPTATKKSSRTSSRKRKKANVSKASKKKEEEVKAKVSKTRRTSVHSHAAYTETPLSIFSSEHMDANVNTMNITSHDHGLDLLKEAFTTSHSPELHTDQLMPQDMLDNEFSTFKKPSTRFDELHI